MTAQTQNNVAQMKTMVKEVMVDGKDVFVVVPNIKKFKTEAVEKLTSRPNKRRTAEHRFNWLFYAFVRQTINENNDLARKHVGIHLLAATEQDGLFRNEKGAFVTIEKIKAQKAA